MKKIMILGAGPCQINGIDRMKALGLVSIVSDYSVDSPGKKRADISVLADTFSYEETLKQAKKYKIDGIYTMGTDQPVYTASLVAEALNLPFFIASDVAYTVTNKKAMKDKFKSLNLPTVDYRIINKAFKAEDLEGLKFPVVVKPLDAQGQRGIYKLNTIKEIHDHFDRVISFSKVKEILVESYYENEEVTVSGWLVKDQVHILSITDRVTFEPDQAIGVCIAHDSPSKHMANYGDQLMALTETICQGFKISNGPIYFQFLIGDEGIKITEIACWIGGAYEDVTIFRSTGIPILDFQIKAAYKADYGQDLLKDYVYTPSYFSTELFFSKAGKMHDRTSETWIKSHDFVWSAAYNYDLGHRMQETSNATSRLGHFIVTGENEDNLPANLEKNFQGMYVYDEKENLIIKRKRIWR